MRKVFYNAVVVTGGRRFAGYVEIENEYITRVGEGVVPDEMLAQADEREDLGGAYLFPGVIDDQVHFRDPGLTHKGDIASESAAAVAGGVTSFMDMPNTNPQTTTLEALEAKYRRGAEVSVANYSFFIGATNDNIDALLACDYSRVPGVKLFLGASTGNMLVDHEAALNRIFGEVPALIAIHSEDEEIIRRNKAAAQEKWGEDVPVEEHWKIRSSEACYESTRRAVAMAQKHNARLHILHISTAAELEFLTTQSLEEKRITAEVCAHHLWWSDEAYARLGSRVKWNPAIKTSADRAALRKALKEGRIDIVATDHAPHLLTEKEGGALKAASGGPLVQYSLLMMLELVKQGVFEVEQVIDYMCHKPARLYAIEERGYIAPHYKADLVVVKPVEGYEVKDADVLSRCGWTPLVGETLHHRVVATYVNGQCAYRDGVVNNAVRGEALKFRN